MKKKFLMLLCMSLIIAGPLTAQIHLQDTPAKRAKYTMQKFAEYTELPRATFFAAAKLFQTYYTNIEGVNKTSLLDKAVREKFDQSTEVMQRELATVLDATQLGLWLRNIWPDITNDIQKN